MQRNFRPAAPDRLYVADITQHGTAQGWYYLAVVLDCFSRRVIGWAMADHLRAELVVDALQMAIWNRRPRLGTIHHSDHGSQGGLKRSSQHLDSEELRWGGQQDGRRQSRAGRLCDRQGGHRPGRAVRSACSGSSSRKV